MRNEHDANLSLIPMDRKPIEPRAIVGFVAGVVSAWFGG